MKIPYSMLGIPDREVLNKELSEQIRIAVESLPQKQKKVFTLTECDDKSCKQVASLTGCKAKTINTLLRIAKKNLRQKLEAYLKGEF